MSDDAIREFVAAEFAVWSASRAGREKPINEDRQLGRDVAATAMAVFSPEPAAEQLSLE